MSTKYGPGDAVVVIGQGVGHVVSVDAERLVARLAEGEVTIHAADVDSLLRPTVDRDQAQRFLERICERCTEERTLPQLRSHRELARAPLDRQVEYVRLYFRRKKSLLYVEAEMILAVSEDVLEELAAALGAEPASVRTALKKGKPVVESAPVRPLPRPPVLPGSQYLRSFWLGTTAIVGEWPEQSEDILKVAVARGAWHSYQVQYPVEGDDDLEGILLVHADAGSSLSAGNVTIDVGGVNLEGGTIGILDAAALTDDAFGGDEVERLRRAENGYGDRGVEVGTWGDGDHRVLVDNRDAAKGIFIPF